MEAAVGQLKLAEEHSTRLAVDPTNIYEALAKSYKYLGREKESHHYEALARSVRS
jgi:hypothetical protein